MQTLKKNGWLTAVLFAALMLGPAFAGCFGGVHEERITVDAANDPLNLPRSILQRYAEGQQLGSEVSTFPSMVEAVREVDPERADILEAGLQELQEASPAARPGIAKKVLEQIAPAMN